MSPINKVSFVFRRLRHQAHKELYAYKQVFINYMYYKE